MERSYLGKQGLDTLVDEIKSIIPDQTSDLENDSKFINYTETSEGVSIVGKEPLYKDVEYKDLTTTHKTIIAAINDAANSSGGEVSDVQVDGTSVLDEDGIAHITLSDKQNKLVAGDNIHIDASTNTISAQASKGDRGLSILSVETAPYSNVTPTPDGKVHQMAISIDTIKSETHVDAVYLSDVIMYSGFLYEVNYIDTNSAIAYVDNIGNIRGPQGVPGIQGPQGIQGPKGEAGEGYFILTDDDYTRVVNFVEERSYYSYQRSDSTQPLKPNYFYDFGPQYQLSITFAEPEKLNRTNEYMFQFESPSDRPTTLILPDSVKWCYSPVIETNKTYQVSVLNNLAVICGA